MVEIIKIIKGRQLVDPHTPQNEARMLGNSLEDLLKQEKAVSGQGKVHADKRVTEYREKIKHQRGS